MSLRNGQRTTLSRNSMMPGNTGLPTIKENTARNSQRAATVGARMSSPRQHLRDCTARITGTSTIEYERQWNLYHQLNSLDHGELSLRNERDVNTSEELQLRNHSFQYHQTRHLSKYHNGHVKNRVQELHREHERMHYGYLSLHHNWNTKNRRRNCWNLSLMITETSTIGRKESAPGLRELSLPPILPLPPRGTGGRLGGIVAIHCLHELPHPAHLERSEAREGHECHELRLHHLPLLSPLPLLLLLLLLLLQRQVLLEEESEGGAVDAVVAAQRRHHQERSVSRGVPHGAVTPLRPGVKETARPHPREWRLLCP